MRGGQEGRLEQIGVAKGAVAYRMSTCKITQHKHNIHIYISSRASTRACARLCVVFLSFSILPLLLFVVVVSSLLLITHSFPFYTPTTSLASLPPFLPLLLYLDAREIVMAHRQRRRQDAQHQKRLRARLSRQGGRKESREKGREEGNSWYMVN